MEARNYLQIISNCVGQVYVVHTGITLYGIQHLSVSAPVCTVDNVEHEPVERPIGFSPPVCTVGSFHNPVSTVNWKEIACSFA